MEKMMMKDNKEENHGSQKLTIYATRSCTSCRQRRKKCDRDWPSCQKCAGRLLPCKYPSDTEPTEKPPPISIPRKEKKSPLENGIADAVEEGEGEVYSSMNCQACRAKRRSCSKEWSGCDRCRRSGEVCKYPPNALLTNKVSARKGRHRQLARESEPVTDREQSAVDPSKKYSTMNCLNCRTKRRRCTRDWEGCQRCRRNNMPCKYPTAAVISLSPVLAKGAKKLKEAPPTPPKPPVVVYEAEDDALAKQYSSLNCVYCRSRRARCTREWDGCHRCKHNGFPCEYPPSATPTNTPLPINMSKSLKNDLFPYFKPESTKTDNDDASPSCFASVSCERCRTIKQRCSREMPKCSTCRYNNHLCTYLYRDKDAHKKGTVPFIKSETPCTECTARRHRCSRKLPNCHRCVFHKTPCIYPLIPPSSYPSSPETTKSPVQRPRSSMTIFDRWKVDCGIDPEPPEWSENKKQQNEGEMEVISISSGQETVSEAEHVEQVPARHSTRIYSEGQPSHEEMPMEFSSRPFAERRLAPSGTVVIYPDEDSELEDWEREFVAPLDASASEKSQLVPKDFLSGENSELEDWEREFLEPPVQDKTGSPSGKCLQCKKWNIRCDRKEPQCSRCQKLQQACLYPAGAPSEENSQHDSDEEEEDHEEAKISLPDQENDIKGDNKIHSSTLKSFQAKFAQIAGRHPEKMSLLMNPMAAKRHSQYRGVYSQPGSFHWCAMMNLSGGITKYLGAHDTEEKAAKVYDAAVRQMFEGVPSQQICNFDSDGYRNLQVVGLQSDNPSLPYQRASWYKGVQASGAKWVAQISIGEQSRDLGSYKTELEAAVAHDSYAKEHGLEGKVALNFPLGVDQAVEELVKALDQEQGLANSKSSKELLRKNDELLEMEFSNYEDVRTLALQLASQQGYIIKQRYKTLRRSYYECKKERCTYKLMLKRDEATDKWSTLKDSNLTHSCKEPLSKPRSPDSKKRKLFQQSAPDECSRGRASVTLLNFDQQPTYSTRPCNGCRALRKKCSRVWPACTECIKRGRSCEYPPDAMEGIDPPPPFVPKQPKHKPAKANEKDSARVSFPAPNIEEGGSYSSRPCLRCRALKSRCPREWPGPCERCSRSGQACNYPPDAIGTNQPPPPPVKRKTTAKGPSKRKTTTAKATQSAEINGDQIAINSNFWSGANYMDLIL